MSVWHLRVGEKSTRLVDLIGNTPLLPLNAVADGVAPGVRVYGKAEFTNPGGSVKDRPALNMILEAERDGRLRAGGRILEATSGNTGIALAMVGASRGYPVTLCLPENANRERRSALLAYGAELILTDPAEQIDGAIRKARGLYTESPDDWFYPDQYGNDANWRAHYDGTGVEIWNQTHGEVTHFVAGLGTSGTFMGTGRRLKERNRAVRLVSMQPASPWHGLEGLKHMETALVPRIWDESLADDQVTVETEEAQAMARRLGREMGLLVGVSAGANVLAAIRKARELAEGVVVTILCDGGERYLSEPFWREE